MVGGHLGGSLVAEIHGPVQPIREGFVERRASRDRAGGCLAAAGRGLPLGRYVARRRNGPGAAGTRPGRETRRVAARGGAGVAGEFL